MAADLTSSAGVVTIDLNANPSDFYRLSTTENVTSWVTTGETDGDGFLLLITRNAGHTVAFTGLVDTWTVSEPTIAEGETLIFPMIYNNGTWIGESAAAPVAAHPANLIQILTHSVSGVFTANIDLGHTMQVTLTADITSHSFTNNVDGQVFVVTYQASAATRNVDFTSEPTSAGFTNPGNVALSAGEIYRATFLKTFAITYLIDAELVA